MTRKRQMLSTYDILEKVDTDVSVSDAEGVVEELGPIPESWVRSGGLAFLAPAGPTSNDPRETPEEAKFLVRATNGVYVKNILSLTEFEASQLLCVVDGDEEWRTPEAVEREIDDIDAIIAAEGFMPMSKLRIGNLNLAKFLAPETGPYGRRSLKKE